MPFLRGSLAFERFHVSGFDGHTFEERHLEILQQHVAGQFETDATDNVQVGFLGGSHLFDYELDLGKNLINDALHFSVRIDTNAIPAAIRNAWLQLELAGLMKDSASGRPTKAQRQEAKEAVEQRSQVEAASGKYRKMQQFPILWDLAHETLYFGGSAGAACGHCLELIENRLNVELHHAGAGMRAQAWAADAQPETDLEDLVASSFQSSPDLGTYHWSNEYASAPDFLGNEFLMWLWWTLENESDSVQLADGSEATVMFAKTLSLECPLGEHGKETISAECPTRLSEALQAIHSGKLPRKAGLTIVRQGRQFDLVLQAESLAVSGAKIHLQEGEQLDDHERIDAIRHLSDTIDQLFFHFCSLRTARNWKSEQQRIIEWITGLATTAAKAAA